MGTGNSQNFWNPGNDGVRLTIVRADNGIPVTVPIDFSRRAQPSGMIHFNKVSKTQYRSGQALTPGGNTVYTSYTVANEMPIIISSQSLGASSIDAIKRYFCSEYVIRRVCDTSGFHYENILSGNYKILIEPIAYFTYRGNLYAMTATEAALYDQKVNGDLRSWMPSLCFQNLPLSLFLEHADLGYQAWSGSRTGRQSNADIIQYLGLGIVRFGLTDYDPEEGTGDISAPDVEYRVNTDVITSVTLRAERDVTPDHPASVTFVIDGHTYRVNNVVIPAGDSQVVWVKWHTPTTPKTIPIKVNVSGAYTAKTSLNAKIVDLDDNPPPDPKATDRNPKFTVPNLPNNSQKTTANWGVWSCWWVTSGEDGEGHWEFEYTSYSARISGSMELSPDTIVPTAKGKEMKSGYGVKANVSATLSTAAPSSHYTMVQTALSTFPEFQYQTYSRLLERYSGGLNAKFRFKPNEYSTYNRNVHFSPVWYPDNERFTVYTRVWDAWTPDGMLSMNVHDYVTIQRSVFDDWYTSRE